MLGVGKCWEIRLESDGNTPFIPICRAEPGPKCFVPKSSAEMMSPYFWVTAMTVVPEKLMSYAILSSCGCPCLNLVDAVIGHSFFLSPVLPLHSHSSSQWHSVVSAALLLFCPRCTATTWFCASASGGRGRKFPCSPQQPTSPQFVCQKIFVLYLLVLVTEWKGLYSWNCLILK